MGLRFACTMEYHHSNTILWTSKFMENDLKFGPLFEIPLKPFPHSHIANCTWLVPTVCSLVFCSIEKVSKRGHPHHYHHRNDHHHSRRYRHHYHHINHHQLASTLSQSSLPSPPSILIAIIIITYTIVTTITITIIITVVTISSSILITPPS